ncbi:MAG: hypothetical protein R6U91_06625 [Bacillota bacterium]
MKLIDWDLKPQPVIEASLTLEFYRITALEAHLADTVVVEKESPFNKTWGLPQHILQHTFSFISYNPVNRTVTSSTKRTVSFLTRKVVTRIRKRSPLITRLIPDQA